MKERYGEWSFFRHSCIIRVEGFRAEKLLSKAHASGLMLRNVRVISETELIMQVSADDLKRLKKLAGAVYKITVIERKGAKEQALRAARKPVTLVGVAAAVAVMVIESMFVASVRINGCRAISEDALRYCLTESGITEGAFIPKIDWEAAETALRSTFPQLAWIQLVYDGRVILLNVSESDAKFFPTKENKGEEKASCSSIVAERAGYVEEIDVRLGKAMVEPGDFVRKGQVLISGIVPIEATTYENDWPTECYVRAAGEIRARVPYRVIFRQERCFDGREKGKNHVQRVVNQQIRTWSKENLPENAEILNNSLNFSYKKNIIEIGATLEVLQQIGKDKEENTIGEKNSDN